MKFILGFAVHAGAFVRKLHHFGPLTSPESPRGPLPIKTRRLLF